MLKKDVHGSVQMGPKCGKDLVDTLFEFKHCRKGLGTCQLITGRLPFDYCLSSNTLDRNLPNTVLWKIYYLERFDSYDCVRKKERKVSQNLQREDSYVILTVDRAAILVIIYKSMYINKWMTLLDYVNICKECKDQTK